MMIHSRAKPMRHVMFSMLILLICVPAVAGAARIEGVRTWAGPNETRVVFDLSGAVEHKLFTLKAPARVVLDLESAEADHAVIRAIEAQGILKGLRSGVRNGSDLRVVLDLSEDARAKSFMVKPNEKYGYRLVVDLENQAAQQSAPVKTIGDAARRDLIIAIDAGHGGEDPGAIGKYGTHEKDVVMGVAKKLADLIEKQPGMKPLLIRTGDYYVGLRGRTMKARKYQADIFISIHADAVNDRRVTGSSVYTLSTRGASTEAARMLAKRENSSDLIGGVTLDDKDPLVATVLVDLSRRATSEASTSLAATLLQSLDRVGEVRKPQVEHAGFVVLKSLDMPSVLVELAFISNPTEEKRLRDSNHQWKLAKALMEGVISYTRDHMSINRMASADSTFGPDEHVVRRGDTLSDIARQYDVSLAQLRSANNIRNDRILVGSKLLIPR